MSDGPQLLASTVGLIASDLAHHLVPPGMTVRMDADAAVAPLPDGHLAVCYYGDLYCSTSATSAVGRIERILDTSEAVADHESLLLDASVSGKQRGKQALISAVALYKRLGISEVRLHAADVGRYAWASAGFEFASDEDRAAVLDGVEEMADRLQFRVDRSQVRHPWHLAMLGPDILVDTVRAAENDLESLSDLRAFVPGTMLGLGKALMLSGACPPWSGVLRFASKTPGSDRFVDYSQ